MKPIQKLANSQSDVLKKQRIDESGPGTILADFQTLLDFVGIGGIATGGKNYRIPLAALSHLDERMIHPLRPKLERPQQLSFPHLNGLYLLLRASGLGVSSGQSTTGRLSIAPDVLAEWNTLNAEERYFTLLQAMIVADWSLIESSGGSGRGDVWMYLAGKIAYWYLRRERVTNTGTPASDLFHGWRDQTGAALLELFGILELPRVEPQEGENWRIAGLKSTDFGTALLARLRDSWGFPQLLDDVLENSPGNPEWLGDLFREFFPNCMKTLSLADGEFVDGVWQFKVSWGKVWRRILVPADLSTEALISAVLKEFKFDNDHLYALQLRDRSGRNIEIGHPALDTADYFTDEFGIGSLPLDPGQSMKFLFDFGDNWQFTVKLEKILPPDPAMTEPKVTTGKGEPPQQYGSDDDDDGW